MDATPIRSYPGLTNYEVHVPGTNVTAYLGVRDAKPDVWLYSLWTGRNGEEGPTELIATGDLTFPERVTPEQVARIVFLLDIEYGKKG